MEQKAMERITERVGEVLSAHQYSLAQQGNAKNGSPSLFLSETTAYAIDYERKEKRFVLKSTTVEEGKLGAEWTNNAVWLFDPAQDTMSDAESIANDFVDSLTTATVRREAAVQQQRKRKEKGDEHYVDPGFLMNRFANVFPELKYAIAAQREIYGGVAPHTLLRDFLYAMMDEVLADPTQEARAQKFFEVINVNYANGDLDTKSVLMLGVLNHLETPRALELAEKYLDEKTKKAWQHAKKYKNKKVRPEKVKRVKKLNAEKSLGSLK